MGGGGGRDALRREDKTDLVHFHTGCADLSQVSIRFGGKDIMPLDSVKRIRLPLDRTLSGRDHIQRRARALTRSYPSHTRRGD
jgi:hypothetical protein